MNFPLIPNNFPPNDLHQIHAMLSQLCRNIGFANTIDGIEVKRGSNYTIILFSCVLNRPPPGSEGYKLGFALRVEKMSYRVIEGLKKYGLQMGRTVAFQHYSFNYFEGAGVCAYDTSYDNAIGCSYIIERKKDKPSLMQHYARLNTRFLTTGSINIREYEAYASAVAEFLWDQESCSLPCYGTIQAPIRAPVKSFNTYEAFDRLQPGIAPWMQSASMQANTKYIDFICDFLSGQKNTLRDPIEEQRYQKLAAIAWELKVLGDEEHLAHSIQPSIIWHSNFVPRNISMSPFQSSEARSQPEESTYVSAVFGWDGALALPRIMARLPPSFLWEGHGHLKDEERNLVKRRFDEEIEKHLPGYCREVYGEMPMILRALGFYTVLGVCDELSFGGLEEAWDSFVVEQERRSSL